MPTCYPETLLSPACEEWEGTVFTGVRMSTGVGEEGGTPILGIQWGTPPSQDQHRVPPKTGPGQGTPPRTGHAMHRKRCASCAFTLFHVLVTTVITTEPQLQLSLTDSVIVFNCLWQRILTESKLFACFW